MKVTTNLVGGSSTGLFCSNSLQAAKPLLWGMFVYREDTSIVMSVWLVGSFMS